MSPHTKNRALWPLQSLLAVLFLFAGAAKLLMPAQALAKASGLPTTLLRFIAVCELLGAFGLVLPGLLRIKEFLTPLAAVGLVTIMAGATTLTGLTQGFGPAMFPLAVGTLLAVVAIGRRRLPSLH